MQTSDMKQHQNTIKPYNYASSDTLFRPTWHWKNKLIYVTTTYNLTNVELIYPQLQYNTLPNLFYAIVDVDHTKRPNLLLFLISYFIL